MQEPKRPSAAPSRQIAIQGRAPLLQDDRFHFVPRPPDADNLSEGSSVEAQRHEATVHSALTIYKKSARLVGEKFLPEAVLILLPSITKFAETAILARFGSEQLGASALITPSTSLIITMIASALSGGLNATLGKVLRNPDDYPSPVVGDIYRASLIFGGLFSVPLMGLCYWGDHLFGLTPISAQVIDSAAPYFHYFTFGIPAYMGVFSGVQLLYMTNNHNWLIPISMARAGIELGVNAILLYTLFNKKEDVTKALGLASMIQPWILVALIHVGLWCKKDLKNYRLFSLQFRGVAGHLQEIVKMGLPVAAQMGTELLSKIAVSVMVGMQGIVPLAAYQIAYQYAYFMSAINLALARAVGAQTGLTVYGDRLTHYLRPITLVGLGYCALSTTAFMTVMAAVPRPLSQIFMRADDVNREEVFALAKNSLLIVGAGSAAFGARDILAGSLSGIKTTLAAALISIFTALVVGDGMSYLLGHHLQLGIDGVTFGLLIGAAIGALCMSPLWFKKTDAFMNQEDTDSAAASALPNPTVHESWTHAMRREQESSGRGLSPNQDVFPVREPVPAAAALQEGLLADAEKEKSPDVSNFSPP